MRRAVPYLFVTVVYLGVAAVGIAVLQPDEWAAATRTEGVPLAHAAERLQGPGLGALVSAGGIIAMIGVLLNLILGVSRVLLAMARRGDMPASLARIIQRETLLFIAVWTVGLLLAGFILTGNLYRIWSFSAFTVLIYYAITNLAALRLPADKRLFPRWIAIVGLGSCLFIAFWVEQVQYGLGLIGAGFIWHGIALKRNALAS